VSGCFDVIKGRLEDSKSTYHRRVRRLTDAKQSEEHAVSAVEEYKRIDRRGFRDDWGQISPQKAMDYADAAIAELEAENNSLTNHLSAYIIERGLADAVRTELEDALSDITIERLRKKQTELAENGGCPCCLAGDEEGHILGCELSEAEAALAERDRDHEMLVRALRNQGSWEIDDILDRYPYAARAEEGT